ncbi:NAD(P)-binding protein [Serendipita vermifera]|nr:NAD(P)-binding protein [Serendipita vermifera]
MPAISTSSKVLLTGATGFLGAQTLKYLLENGFFVRIAVRSESKVEFLRSRFHEHQSNFEFVIVEDITTPGAFDEAVKGVEGILHLASPLSGPDPDIDPQVLIDPAVNGTVGILKSAHKAGGDVKRVAITSSGSAVWNKQGSAVFTEDDWNWPAVELAKKTGKAAPIYVKYAASKTLAEQAAWKFVEENSPSFDIVTLLPTFVWGQILSETTADIKGSNNRLLGVLKKEALENLNDEQLLEERWVVDARDAAQLHVQALINSQAGGRRIILTTPPITVQHILDILNSDPVPGIIVPKGKPELLEGWNAKVLFSNELSRELLGAEYTPIEDTVRTTLTHALEVGWHQ